MKEWCSGATGVTARERHGRLCNPLKNWGGRREVNPQPSEPQSDALPIELLPPQITIIAIAEGVRLVPARENLSPGSLLESLACLAVWTGRGVRRVDSIRGGSISLQARWQGIHCGLHGGFHQLRGHCPSCRLRPTRLTMEMRR